VLGVTNVENRLRVKGRYGDYSNTSTGTGTSGISGTPGTTTSSAAAGGGKSSSNT